MSFQTWHIYGYGICVDDIKAVPVDRIQNMLKCAPAYHAQIQEYFREHGITEPKYEDYLEYDDGYYLGLTTLMKEVILEAEQFEFTACGDFDGRGYLVYEPSYPWNTSKMEESLTEEKVRSYLGKYISILTDESIEIDYQSVENGG